MASGRSLAPLWGRVWGLWPILVAVLGGPGLCLPQGRGLMWGQAQWVMGQCWWGPSRSGERSPSPFAG